MTKNIFVLVLITLLLGSLLAAPTSIYAAKEAGSSAMVQNSYLGENLKTGLEQPSKAIQRATIKKILEKYNSPMVDSVDTFVEVADKYNLNPYLLPSISGLESGFGKHILPGSYNAWGWGGGYYYLGSWDEAIETVAKGLRNGYVDKGRTTIEQIAPIYSESPTWAPRVRIFMNEFEREEDKQSKKQLLFSLNAVKL